MLINHILQYKKRFIVIVFLSIIVVVYLFASGPDLRLFNYANEDIHEILSPEESKHFYKKIEKSEEGFDADDPRFRIHSLSSIELAKIFWSSKVLKLDLKASKLHIGRKNGIEVYFKIRKKSNSMIKGLRALLKDPKKHKKFFTGLHSHIKDFVFQESHYQFLNHRFLKFIYLIQASVAQSDYINSRWRIEVDNNDKIIGIIFLADALQLRTWIQSKDNRFFNGSLSHVDILFPENSELKFRFHKEKFEDLKKLWGAKLFERNEELIIQYIFYRCLSYDKNILFKDDPIFSKSFFDNLKAFFKGSDKGIEHLLHNYKKLEAIGLIDQKNIIKSKFTSNMDIWKNYFIFLQNSRFLKTGDTFELRFLTLKGNQEKSKDPKKKNITDDDIKKIFKTLELDEYDLAFEMYSSSTAVPTSHKRSDIVVECKFNFNKIRDKFTEEFNLVSSNINRTIIGYLYEFLNNEIQTFNQSINPDKKIAFWDVTQTIDPLKNTSSLKSLLYRCLSKSVSGIKDYDEGCLHKFKCKMQIIDNKIKNDLYKIYISHNNLSPTLFARMIQNK